MTNPVLAIIKNGKIDPEYPLSLPERTRLLITPLPPNQETETLENWELLSIAGLNEAYREEEPEYTIFNIKEINQDYQRE